MIEFKPVTLSDREWMLPFLYEGNEGSADYSFSNLFLWRRMFHPYAAINNERLFIKHQSIYGTSYAFPIGNGDLSEAIDQLKEDALHHDSSLVIRCITERNRSILEELFPGRFTFQERRNEFDYVYLADSLQELKGRKLHAKRNYINHFINTEDWGFEAVCASNIGECRDLLGEWVSLHPDRESDGLEMETPAAYDALEYFDELGLDGGLLKVSGKPVAFTLGEKLGADSYVVHFEKALSSVQGAYQMINREFVRLVKALYPETVYINREDDMGAENLRKAKLSYYPETLIRKYTAVEKRKI